ncbi:type IV secretory pathway TrbL component [Streptomyces sp. SAI-144]|uniref:hyaluronoglucosaminidase n=1 Tax=Streptomyces sp. SAI-144 TaxID=2940544 RepID=UPI00247632DF|nr:hyaluronoglucosaminidase [Streptomyces sp. SAI-144]MDH6439177.1 type IV secretory pathway TrbL component [Streptomyces sp. SAI-144]
MAVGRRLFLGAFTAGTVTVAANGTEAVAVGDYTDYTAPAQFWTRSTTAHAVTAVMAATSGAGAALNVASKNPQTSALNVTGVENARGTVKITHDGYVDGSDADGSALSIDLQTHGVTDRSGGTAAQGIFLTATTGATKGALLVLRNNPGLDDFVVKGSGRVGVGIGVGDTPQSQLHVVQVAPQAASAILAEGSVRLANTAAEPSNAPADLGGGSLYAQNGALFWKGGNGKVTELAPA